MSDALDQCFEFDENANAELIFHHLNKFLDEWDANVDIEKEDMVSLFNNMNSEIYQIKEHQSNDAVGDAAVQYIELSCHNFLFLQTQAHCTKHHKYQILI